MLTMRFTVSPTRAETTSANPSMSPAAWGVVTHQASPVLAFSATMAADTGSGSARSSKVWVGGAVGVVVGVEVAFDGLVSASR